MATYDFYQDIRAYGRGHEEYYERAPKGGTVFVRWHDQEPSDGRTRQSRTTASAALVRASRRPDLGRGSRGCRRPRCAGSGHAAGRRLRARRGASSSRSAPTASSQEVHPKLRPVELSRQRRPRRRHEPRAQGHHGVGGPASAAAAKATALLSTGHVELDPFVAHIDATLCEASGACVAECPYAGAVELREYPDGTKRAVVNPALCSGCGACVAVCPTRAIDLSGWTLDEYDAMVDAIVADRRRRPDEHDQGTARRPQGDAEEVARGARTERTTPWIATGSRRPPAVRCAPRWPRGRAQSLRWPRPPACRPRTCCGT